MSGRGKIHPRRNKAARQWARGDRAWGISERSGQRFFLKDLVEDGQYPGLKVSREEWEPRHPQESAVTGTDAPALRRPSPERDYPAVHALIPGVVPNEPAETQWIVPMRGEVGRITAEAFTRSSQEAAGNEARGEVGDLTVETTVGAVSAFVTGIGARAELGGISAIESAAAAVTSIVAQCQVGTLTVALGVEAVITGVQATGQNGGLQVVGSVYRPSFFTEQFLGITPKAREQLQ